MNSIKVNKSNISKIIFLLFLILLPFSISDYGDNVTPEKITSDLAFYEINTCSISLAEFLFHNINVAYQDHYKIRFNDYSSIRCFGTITGIDQIGNVFYISIGTNALINLFLQTFFWLTLVSFISKTRNYILSRKLFLSSIISSLLFCFGIYSESRYYGKKLFEIDLILFSSYINLFMYFLFISFLISVVIDSREKQIIQYIPFLFLLMGVYSGFNFYIFSFFFTTYGISRVLINKKYLKIFKYTNFVLLVWCLLSIGNNYYLAPDKIRGLSNTSFNSNSLIFWTYLIACIFIGIYEFSSEKQEEFTFKKTNTKFLSVGSFILIFGYLGSSNPIFNFFNYYFLGLSKYGTSNQTLFGFDMWNSRVAWRGMFPSAETIGEFFSLIILIYLINSINTKKINSEIFLLIFPIIGLLASNNKAAVISLIFCIYLKINNSFSIKKIYKTLFYSSASILFLLFIGFENIGYSFEFTANNFINIGNDYILNQQSTSLSYLNNLDPQSIINFLLLAIGQVAYLINRSELWGIFLTRYSPDSLNVLLGSGPYSLAKQYSEINISKYKYASNIEMGFLLPHSSVLLIFLFTGLVGLVTFLYLIIKQLNILKNIEYDAFLVILLLTISMVKSDSILYMPWLIMYLCLLFIYKSKYSNGIKS